MKLAATILTLAATAAAQASSASLTALQQCLQKTCPNNIHDVACQAACLGLPNPNASMIADTAACYAKCPATDQQAQIDCKNKCDQIYNPSGSIISNHLTPDGVSPVSTPTSTSKTDTTKPTSKPQSPQPSGSSSGTVPPKSDSHNSNDSDSDSNNSNSDSTSSSKTNGAAALKAAFSAVAIVAAAAMF
ncbi:hypothetical protein GGI19_003748 [Coemansia pectinata]|uniref:Uncharacterized protein n=1 Tax=Coemansia pectinata TaxID=1052879 RepID=A0A9W8GXC8_9FUNG|nr:hypothetical protein GGI19_003748 [Coemansia pectinata]